MMGWWLLLGAVPIDSVGAPLPLYLSTSQVVMSLRDLEPALVACGVGGNWTVRLHLAIDGAGSAKEVRLQRDSEPLADRDADCWSDAVRAHRFPEHKDVPIQVETTVYVRGGVTTLSPQPTMARRDPGLLLLFVPSDADAESAVKLVLDGAEVPEE